MDKAKKEQGKKCFIITPIGDEKSDTFRRAKGVIESVIKPVLTEYGFDDIKPAYEINVSGMINTQIINRIIDDDLVIANLTGNNPNVMYELCLRHVVAKPVIHICENGTSLPFDINGSRTVFYENDMLGVEELKDSLKEYLNEINYTKEYSDNPIYNAKQMELLLKQVPEDNGKAIEIALLQKIYEKLDNNSLFNSQSYRMFASEGMTDYSDFYYRIRITKFIDGDYHMIITELQEELEKRHVIMFRTNGNEMCFMNRGNTTEKRIKEIVNTIEKKFHASIEILKYTGEMGYLL